MRITRVLMAAALAASMAVPALALDQKALVGTWQLVEIAKDSAGKPCPYVGQKIEFTADGNMVSGNMPMPFTYKVNPAKEEIEAALARHPQLKDMELMLATMAKGNIDWKKAPIVYGVGFKDKQFLMKVAGYTPAVYKKVK